MTPLPQACAEIQRLAEAWVQAQYRYTACWMDADRDRCRRHIDDLDKALKDAGAAFTRALAALEAENQRMREALEPFVKAADRYGKYGVPLDVQKIEGEFPESLTIGDLRRAAAALSTRPTQAQEKQDE